LNGNKFTTNLYYIRFISDTKVQSFVMVGIEHEHPGAQNAINERSVITIPAVKFLLGGITMRFGPVETDKAAVG
jgi:hypothetical protein